MKFQEFTGLHDLQKAFPNEQVCIDYLERLRWNGNVISPFNKDSKVYKCSDNKYRCKLTKKYFTVRTGTIFADSKIPLTKWMMGIFLFTSHKKGISSIQLGKDLDIKQKAAWFMLHRLRFAMSRKNIFDFYLTGTVEMDESFLGGKEANKHASKKTIERTNDKAVVFGMVERGGKARMFYVPNHQNETIEPIIYNHVSKEARVMTDEGNAYSKIKADYNHQTIKHMLKEYVRGEVHTNTVENLWSCLKRGIYGTYHFTSKKHLQMYLEEFAFRYNRRKQTEYSRFNSFFDYANNGSLKWNDLIQKGVQNV